jgi:serine/threonine protein kinase
VFDQDRTGFEDHKDFQIVINEVIAGRYQIVSVLGQAQFSKAVQVLNLDDGQYYCMKIISNNKDYIDQSIDEIKLLKYINYNSNVDEKHVLKYYDYFYHK